MQKTLLSLPVDPTLTRENAKARGYEWEIDVIRTPQGQIVGIEKIQEKVSNEGYTLGHPWANDPYVAPCGLYKPVTKPAQPHETV